LEAIVRMPAAPTKSLRTFEPTEAKRYFPMIVRSWSAPCPNQAVRVELASM